MKRRLAILSVIVILLSGCVNITTDGTDLIGDTQLSTDQPEWNAGLHPELNAQNKYISPVNFNFQEAEDFFCGTMFSSRKNFIQYYDKTTGVSGVLCADPTCSHDSKECGAYTEPTASVLYYNEKLYRVILDTSNSRDMLLCESDLSGMNRKTVMQISWDDVIIPYQPQRYALHQGKLYLVGRAPAASATEAGYRLSLLSRALDGDEPFSVLYDEVFSCGVQETVRFIGNYVYFSVVSYCADGLYDLTITRFDVQGNGVETVYQESGMAEIPGAVWVTDDHEMYLPGYTGERAYLWKLENNERTEIKVWNTGEEPNMGEDVVVVTSQENDTKFVEVCDFSGNPIYSGKLFPDSIDGVNADPNSCGVGFFGVDTEKLILFLIEADDTTYMEYAVLLDLKNNLEATLLWSDTR